jgi:hypothetical protein
MSRIYITSTSGNSLNDELKTGKPDKYELFQKIL